MPRSASRMDAFDLAYAVAPRRTPFPILAALADLLEDTSRRVPQGHIDEVIEAARRPARFMERALVLTAREQQAFPQRAEDRVRMHLVSRDQDRLVALGGLWVFWCAIYLHSQTTAVVVPDKAARRQFLARAVETVARVPGYLRGTIRRVACDPGRSWIEFNNSAVLLVCTPNDMPRSMAISNAFIYDFAPRSPEALRAVLDYLGVWQAHSRRVVVLSPQPQTELVRAIGNDPFPTVFLDD